MLTSGLPDFALALAGAVVMTVPLTAGFRAGSANAALAVHL